MVKHVIRDSDGNITKYLDDDEYNQEQAEGCGALLICIFSGTFISIGVYILKRISGPIDTPIEKIILIALIVGSIWVSLRFFAIILKIVAWCIGGFILYWIIRWIFE